MIKTAELRSDGIDVKVHFQDFKNNVMVRMFHSTITN